MERYSKKRQAILDCLRATKSHPTADWIYTQLKPKLPDLSLATVYRNLGQLKEAGLIRTVGNVDGNERYDGNAKDHPHAVCTSCGTIIDVEDYPLPEEYLSHIMHDTGFEIVSTGIEFSGTCCECRKKSAGTS